MAQGSRGGGPWRRRGREVRADTWSPPSRNAPYVVEVVHQASCCGSAAAEPDAPQGSTSYGSARALAASSKDRKSTRLNSSHGSISYAVFCLKKKKKKK